MRGTVKGAKCVGVRYVWKCVCTLACRNHGAPECCQRFFLHAFSAHSSLSNPFCTQTVSCTRRTCANPSPPLRVGYIRCCAALSSHRTRRLALTVSAQTCAPGCTHCTRACPSRTLSQLSTRYCLLGATICLTNACLLTRTLEAHANVQSFYSKSCFRMFD